MWPPLTCSSSDSGVSISAPSSRSPASLVNSTETLLVLRTTHNSHGRDIQSSNSSNISSERHVTTGSHRTRRPTGGGMWIATKRRGIPICGAAMPRPKPWASRNAFRVSVRAAFSSVSGSSPHGKHTSRSAGWPRRTTGRRVCCVAIRRDRSGATAARTMRESILD